MVFVAIVAEEVELALKGPLDRKELKGLKEFKGPKEFKEIMDYLQL